MAKKSIPERKITTKKLDKNEWQEHIRKSIQQQHQRDHKQERKERIERAKRYKKYIPISIIIGAAASMILWRKEFGARLLIQTILEWTIGITIVSTIMAATKKLQ